MKDVLEKIQNADDLEMEVIMKAIREWYNKRYPDYDIAYLAMERDYEKRKEQFAFLLRITDEEKEWYESQNKKKQDLPGQTADTLGKGR